MDASSQRDTREANALIAVVWFQFKRKCSGPSHVMHHFSGISMKEHASNFLLANIVFVMLYCVTDVFRVVWFEFGD